METKEQVANKLQEWRIDFTVALVGETKRDDWLCDEWRVRLDKFETQYFTGIGHRTKPRNDWDKARPVKPSAADILYSLLLDSEAINESFSDWCANYGYSDDSLSAFDTYRACCKTGEELRKIFTHQQREELRELLQDY